MIENKYLLVALISLTQAIAIQASKPAQIEDGQVTSNMPATLEILYQKLNGRMAQKHMLETELEELSHYDSRNADVINAHDSRDVRVINARGKVTQKLDLNSYQQKFLLQKSLPCLKYTPIRIFRLFHLTLALNRQKIM